MSMFFAQVLLLDGGDCGLVYLLLGPFGFRDQSVSFSSHLSVKAMGSLAQDVLRFVMLHL